jgi:small subunit ribosomal protein S17
MRKQLRGVVTSDKNAKTIRVVVERRYRHPKYGKIVRGRTVCHTHDENGDAKTGDVVDIVECRPRSALKRWELVQVVTRADEVQVAAAAEIERMDPTAAPSDE